MLRTFGTELLKLEPPVFDAEESSIRSGPRRAGHRARPASETLAAYSAVGKQIGITRLACLTGLDTLGIPVYAATRPLSRSLVVSMGKGVTRAAAKASAFMESIETWHAENITPQLQGVSYNDLRQAGASVIDATALPCYAGTAFQANAPVSWVRGLEVFSGQQVWTPWEAVSLDLTQAQPVRTGLVRGSNGLASGNTMAEAVLHATCEIIERDADALWRASSQFRRVRADTVPDRVSRGLLDRFARAGVEVAIWDMTSDTGIHAFGCTIVPGSADRFWRSLGVHSGFGCHPSPKVALRRALTEAAQTRMAYISGSRDDLTYEELASSSAQETTAQIAAELAGIKSTEAFPEETSPTAAADEIDHVLASLQRAGSEQAVLVDLSRADLGVPVVKMLVPGFEGPAQMSAPGARISKMAQP